MGSQGINLNTGTNVVELTLIDNLLHTACFNLIHVGRSNNSIKISSSSSRLDISPSPFNVLKLILSGDRFLVNLLIKKNFSFQCTQVDFIRR